jgi:lipoprotein signal peptidase
LRLRDGAPVACALLFAGVLGNVASWALFGHVPDYLVLTAAGYGLVFNLADAAIAAGLVLIGLHLVDRVRNRGRTA